MSLTIVAIDKTGDKMIVISDRRCTKFKGKQLYFDHDKSVKHHIINERICFMPGSLMRENDDKPGKRLAFLMQFANLPTSILIQIVKEMDRREIGLDGNPTHAHVILCGLNDENEFFTLAGQPDGTFTYQREKLETYKVAIVTNGEHLQSPTAEYLADRINQKGDTLLEALKRTVKYVSIIEKTVSSTYIFTVINKKNNGNIWQNRGLGY